MTHEEKIKALTHDLVKEWVHNHYEHCRGDWPHEGPCLWPLPNSIKDMAEEELHALLSRMARAALAIAEAAFAKEIEAALKLPPIELDEQDPSREYIPLPGGWEIQTKGCGSSYRLCDTKTGERHNILGSDAAFVRDFVTRMAKEIHTATLASTPEKTDDRT